MPDVGGPRGDPTAAYVSGGTSAVLTVRESAPPASADLSRGPTPTSTSSLAPRVDDGELAPFGLRGEVIAEDVPEQAVHHRMQPFVREAVGVLARVPDVDVRQPALGPLDGEVHHQPVRWIVAEAVADALVRDRVDRHVLCEGVHGAPIQSEGSSFQLFTRRSVGSIGCARWPHRRPVAATTAPVVAPRPPP